MVQSIIFAIIIVLSFSPITVFAEGKITHSVDAYSARYSARHGSEIDHLLRSAQFLVDHHASEQEVMCSMATILPVGRGGGFHTLLAEKISLLFSEKRVPLPPTPTPKRERMSSRLIQAILVTQHGCHTMQRFPLQKKRKAPSIPLDSSGIPVSNNDVWNACVRNQSLSADLIRENPDTFEHRQGRIRKKIPWSCRDYHRGEAGWWIYPDQVNTELLFTRNGQYIGVKRE